MSEKIPTSENDVEKNPSEREVLDLFDEIIGDNFEILRSLEDAEGLYMLEVQRISESGEIEQYNYIRQGNYAEGSSSETVIDVVFIIDDIPVGGHAVKKLKAGVWVDEV